VPRVTQQVEVWHANISDEYVGIVIHARLTYNRNYVIFSRQKLGGFRAARLRPGKGDEKTIVFPTSKARWYHNAHIDTRRIAGLELHKIMMQDST
jgi:hypothetical protein